MTTIITGIASILVIAILIGGRFSGTGTTSISEKIAIDRLAILLPSADQGQTLLGFAFLPWQRLAGFATTPVTFAILEYSIIRLVGIGSARV